MPKQSVKEVLSVSLRASSLKKEVTLAFYSNPTPKLSQLRKWVQELIQISNFTRVHENTDIERTYKQKGHSQPLNGKMKEIKIRQHQIIF